MALPTNPKTPWPPPKMAPVLQEVRNLGAWYSNDWARIRNVTQPSDLGAVFRNAQSAREQSTSNNTRSQLVVPMAGDVARTSADLLFSETPVFTCEETAAQDRLNSLLDLMGFESMLLEAAELCAAKTGIYWRLTWDRTLVSDRPILSFLQQDNAVPEWRMGILTAITFWSVLDPQGADGDKTVWRHLERHSTTRRGALVEHGLYLGTDDQLGQPMPLTDHPDTRSIADALTNADEGGDGQAIVIDDVPMTAGYIPNVRPNRRDPGSMLGRADVDGLFTELSGINEAWTSWMRDLRLAKARLVVPSSYLDAQGAGRGAVFDIDRELYEATNMMPPKDGGPGLTLVQFAIRTDEHERTIKALAQQVITSAGYSLRSFGMADAGNAATATEVRSHERLSLITRERKTRYWDVGLRDLLFCLLALDDFMGNPDAEAPELVTTEFKDSVSEDPKAVAETANLLFQAQAATIETRVRLVHPDWDDERVTKEVEGIQSESGQGPVENPDPGEIDPNADPAQDPVDELAGGRGPTG